MSHAAPNVVQTLIELDCARPFDPYTNVLDQILFNERATQRHHAKLRELQYLGVTTPVETWAGVFGRERILVFSRGCTRTETLHLVTVLVDRDDWRWKKERPTCDQNAHAAAPVIETPSNPPLLSAETPAATDPDK